MRPMLSLLVLTTLLGVAACGGSGATAPGPAAPPDAFVHRTAPGAGSGMGTLLDHPLVNAKPGVIVHASPREGHELMDAPLAVGYSPGFAAWSVVFLAGGSYLSGASFNVLVRPAGPRDFVHGADAASIQLNASFLDHPELNANPDAMLLVTPRAGAGDTPNDHHVGVWYQVSTGRWAIYNEDLAPMTLNATFHVSIVNADPGAFRHDTGASTVFLNTSMLWGIGFPTDADTMLFATHVYNPRGAPTGEYVDAAIGSRFDYEPGTLITPASIRFWMLQTHGAPPAMMPLGTGFNVVGR